MINGISFGNEDGDSLDRMSKTITGNNKQSRSLLDDLPSLNLAPLKSVSSHIRMLSKDHYEVKLKKSMSASMVARKLQSSNVDIYDIEYSEDLEGNDLIHISSRPLWSVSQTGNVVQIQRVR